MRTTCSDVCEIVTSELIRLKLPIDPDEDDHTDVIDALSMVTIVPLEPTDMHAILKIVWSILEDENVRDSVLYHANINEQYAAHLLSRLAKLPEIGWRTEEMGRDDVE